MRGARKQIAETLKAQLPKRWKVIGHKPTTLDTLDRLTVAVTSRSLGRAPAAPIGAYTAGYTLTLLSPIVANNAAAEDQLDEALDTLVEVIEQHLTTAWETATAVTLDQYLGWDIPINFTASRDTDR